MSNSSRTITPSGICVITFDRPDSSANIFCEQTFAELNAHLDFLTSAEGKAVKGLVITSGKPKFFFAGADLIGFTKDPTPEKLGALISLGHNTFSRITALPIPSVAAIHGLALGGGCEISLACDYRVGSTAKETKIGLPEVMIGILPGWGGSTLLPRLIGLPKALEVILGGKQLAAVPALKAGLFDAVGPREALLELAEGLIKKGKRGPLPKHWMNVGPAAALVARQARASVTAKTGGHYPAPYKALEVAVQALKGTKEQGFALEKQAFIELATGPIARQLLGIFLLTERAKKLALPDDLPTLAGAIKEPRKVERAAVIGAGVMGAGIAQWLAARGFGVTLRDIGAEPLAKGMAAIHKLFGDAVKRKKLTATEARAATDRIVPVAGNVPLRNVDLVIEAAVERLDLKQKLFAELEAATADDVVLATNTSALSIDTIASALKNPGRMVGIHFFNPVHKMQLVEIIRGDRTDAAALDTALRFVKAIGKMPVIVRDRPGFLVNRVLTPYIAEAGQLVAEGYSVVDVDTALERFGMPMGPFRLIDQIGIDVGGHVARDLAERLSTPAFHPGPLMVEMEKRKLLGRKGGRGFYTYEGKESGKPSFNVEIERFPGLPARKPAEAALFVDRLMLPMINEAARVLAEKVVEAPEDVDFSMILGTGWAPFRGGPLRYADSLGVDKVVARLEEFAAKYGERFAPCELLKSMAAKGTGFYPKA